MEGISTYGGTANSFGFVPYLNWLDEAMDTPFQISHVVMLKTQQRQLRTTLAALDGNLAFEQLSSVGLAPNRMSQTWKGRCLLGTERQTMAHSQRVTLSVVIIATQLKKSTARAWRYESKRKADRKPNARGCNF